MDAKKTNHGALQMIQGKQAREENSTNQASHAIFYLFVSHRKLCFGSLGTIMSYYICRQVVLQSNSHINFLLKVSMQM